MYMYVPNIHTLYMCNVLHVHVVIVCPFSTILYQCHYFLDKAHLSTEKLNGPHHKNE